MSVWRLQTRTAAGNISDYCIKNNIVALGWSMRDELSVSERDSITDFDVYCDYADKYYSSYDSVKRLRDVKVDDLIWIRSDIGKYYIGRVDEETEWLFNTTNEAVENDACNQLAKIEWKEVISEGDESCVPGAISTAFIKGSTFQRINKSGVEQYSQLLYNDITKTMHYDAEVELTKDNFYSLLSTDDCEDLLYFWLYHTRGYICVPSSNKISTPNYECVLINPKNEQHIYIQVKKGNVDIDADRYETLDGEVWLLTTEGKILNYEKYENKGKIKIADPEELYKFALSENVIISKSIKMWVEFLCGQSNKKLDGSDKKGIMFDTDKAHDAKHEKAMLMKNRIIAWGDAGKYINSFDVDDYVLYCSKGLGIIAIGRIKSKPINGENCRYCEVEPIIFPKDLSRTTYPSIPKKEIETLLGKNFYFASTRKVPFISESDVEKLVDLLKSKQ